MLLNNCLNFNLCVMIDSLFEEEKNNDKKLHKMKQNSLEICGVNRRYMAPKCHKSHGQLFDFFLDRTR